MNKTLNMYQFDLFTRVQYSVPPQWVSANTEMNGLTPGLSQAHRGLKIHRLMIATLNIHQQSYIIHGF